MVHFIGCCEPPKNRKSRAAALPGGLQVLLCVGRIVFDGLGLGLGGAAVIDGLGVGVDVVRALADGGDGLHDAVLRAQNGGGGVGVDRLCLLAAQDLKTGGAEQNACSEQTKMFHKKSSCYVCQPHRGS